MTVDTRWWIASALAAVMGLTGCAELPTKEAKGKTRSSLGAPKPTAVAPASAETTAKFGIVEWRMFRDNNDLFMTGYNAAGKAVKGISFGVQTADGEQQLRTRINDGSLFKALHSLSTHQTLANQSTMSAATRELVEAAAADVNGQQLTAEGNGTAECTAAISEATTQALACLQGNTKSKAVQAACVAAAKKTGVESEACTAAPPAPEETPAEETPAAEETETPAAEETETPAAEETPEIGANAATGEPEFIEEDFVDDGSDYVVFEEE